MPADNCQPQPLPFESDCEAGEVAPARAPRARAGAAVLTAAAAALVLLAVAGRVGPSTGAATLAAPEAIVAKAEIPCAGFGESCAVSKCCSNPGDKCYRKHAYWSSCNQSCDPYSIYVVADSAWKKTSEPVWDCEEDTDTTSPPSTASTIAADTSTVHSQCTANGESCDISKCCSEPGMTCYKKNDHWSSCNETCTSNSLWTADGWVETAEPVWDCEELHPACTQSGESCAVSRCCADEAMTCYRKDEHWSSCNLTCNTNSMWTADGWIETDAPVWDCEAVLVSDQADASGDGQFPCSENGDNCAVTQCCADPSMTCCNYGFSYLCGSFG